MKIVVILLMLLSGCSKKENIEVNQNMNYDFSVFENVEITNVTLADFDDEQLSVLYRQVQYCQAMCDADIEMMKEIISEDMIFTHMSGKTQTRDEYFKDIELGRLDYHHIRIDNPEIKIDGNDGYITFTSILTANAYGANGTYRMKGTHHYRKTDGVWIGVNR